MFAALGRFIFRARWYVLLAGLLFVVAGIIFGTSVFGKLKNGGFYDPDAESTRVMNALHDNLGHDKKTSHSALHCHRRHQSGRRELQGDGRVHAG